MFEFSVTAYGDPIFGVSAGFLVAGGYHDHIGLNIWFSEGGLLAPDGHTGLHHVATVYPNRSGLVRAVARLFDAGDPVDSERTTEPRCSSTSAIWTAMALRFTTTAR